MSHLSTRLVHQPHLVEWMPHPKFLFDTLRGPGLSTRHSSKQIFFLLYCYQKAGIGNRFLYHVPSHLMFLRCIVVGSEARAYYYTYHPVLSSMFVFNNLSGALLSFMAKERRVCACRMHRFFFLWFCRSVCVCVCSKACLGWRDGAVVESWLAI